ncbi:hypothetical protein SPHINGOT1_230036 [Sphingomonas sp. T1]|nr:hypothetical protein SPHINGOT1_230036 [Sphingomonas sp. T1]
MTAVSPPAIRSAISRFAPMTRFAIQCCARCGRTGLLSRVYMGQNLNSDYTAVTATVTAEIRDADAGIVSAAVRRRPGMRNLSGRLSSVLRRLRPEAGHLSSRDIVKRNERQTHARPRPDPRL